jgi:hypothetical protein
MPRQVNVKAAAKKLTEAITKLIKAEVSRSLSERVKSRAVNLPKAPGKRRKMKLSSKVLKQRKLQGQFMGLVRNLSAAKKAEIKKLRLEKGYSAAIAAARQAAKG